MDLEREVDRIYLQHYVPAGVVINEELEVLQFRGQTGLFLEHRPGQATLNLLHLVKPPLAAELKNAILTVRHTGLPFGKTGLQTLLKGNLYHFSLDVFPLTTGDSQSFLVVFNESELLVSTPSEKVETSKENPPGTSSSATAGEETPGGGKAGEERALPANDEPVSRGSTITQDRDQHEKWLRTFSEVLPVMICYTRADNTTLFFNSAWLSYTGRPEAREANGGWMMGIHPGDQPDFLHLYNQKIEKAEPFQTELRLLRFDGEYCVVSLHAVPVLSATGPFEGYMISCSEIGGRNVLPLATDWNLPQQAPVIPERSVPVPAEPLETFVKTDLNAVLKKVVKEFERLVLEKKAIVQFDQLPIVHAMPKQMEQLFYHLISNALKFTHKDRTPEIWITAKKLSGEKLKRYQPSAGSLLYYELIVQDNGIGLPGKQEFPGTGIGLTQSRKIVLNHKGDIYAESKENEGTRVHIILPARQDATSSFPA